MKNLSILFVAALAGAAVGCNKTTSGGDCTAAIANSMQLAKADMSKIAGSDTQVLDKLRDLGVQHCRDDKWSDDVIACMTGAKTEPDARACYAKMPVEQQQKMNKAMVEAMAPPAGSAAAAK